VYAVSHLQQIVNVVKPACTLIITRRLYKIASLRTVDPSGRNEVHKYPTISSGALSLTRVYRGKLNLLSNGPLGLGCL